MDGVSLSNSSLPNEGFVQIVTKYSGTKSVCWQSLKNSADDVVCRQMGYIRKDSLVKQPAPLSAKDKIFSGSINCNGGENVPLMLLPQVVLSYHTSNVSY